MCVRTPEPQKRFALRTENKAGIDGGKLYSHTREKVMKIWDSSTPPVGVHLHRSNTQPSATQCICRVMQVCMGAWTRSRNSHLAINDKLLPCLCSNNAPTLTLVCPSCQSSYSCNASMLCPLYYTGRGVPTLHSNNSSAKTAW